MPKGEEGSGWRHAIVQRLAAELDAERFGVRAAYACEALEDATTACASTASPRVVKSDESD
jgi:hypothetical protein